MDPLGTAGLRPGLVCRPWSHVAGPGGLARDPAARAARDDARGLDDGRRVPQGLGEAPHGRPPPRRGAGVPRAHGLGHHRRPRRTDPRAGRVPGRVRGVARDVRARQGRASRRPGRRGSPANGGPAPGPRPGRAREQRRLHRLPRGGAGRGARRRAFDRRPSPDDGRRVPAAGGARHRDRVEHLGAAGRRNGRRGLGLAAHRRRWIASWHAAGSSAKGAGRHDAHDLSRRFGLRRHRGRPAAGGRRRRGRADRRRGDRARRRRGRRHGRQDAPPRAVRLPRARDPQPRRPVADREHAVLLRLLRGGAQPRGDAAHGHHLGPRRRRRRPRASSRRSSTA